MNKLNIILHFFLFFIMISFISCNNQENEKRRKCSLYHFESVSITENLYSTHIYYENSMIARFVKEKDSELLFVKVFISDDYEEKILGTLQLNGDTIELSYKHEEPNWLKNKLFGYDFIVKEFELNYYIYGVKQNSSYYIRFNDPIRIDIKGSPIKLKNIRTSIPQEWTLKWRKERLKKR